MISENMVYVSGKGSPEEVNDPCIKEWLNSGKVDQSDNESFNRVLLACVVAGFSIILALGVYVYRRRKVFNENQLHQTAQRSCKASDR